MNTDSVYIQNDKTRKQQTFPDKACRLITFCIKLAVCLAVVTGFCWLLSQLITKEVVIAIGLILGFLIVSTLLKFAFSVIFTVIKWIVVIIAVITILSVI